MSSVCYPARCKIKSRVSAPEFFQLPETQPNRACAAYRCEIGGLTIMVTHGTEYTTSSPPPPQAKNPTIIQAHLKKLFQGIHGVEFNEGETQITAMLSSAGEKVSPMLSRWENDNLPTIASFDKLVIGLPGR